MARARKVRPACVSRAGASVGASDGLSLLADAPIPQPHGGALVRGGTPEGRSKGGRVTAERRAKRREWNEAINDVVRGHIEQLAEIVGELMDGAKGEQYRCPQCGTFGPSFPSLNLKDAADVLARLMAVVKEPEQAVAASITVILEAGRQVPIDE